MGFARGFGFEIYQEECIICAMELLLEFLFSFILLPIFWAVSTPFILIVSLFSKSPYRKAVAEKYDGVTDFWKRLPF